MAEVQLESKLPREWQSCSTGNSENLLLLAAAAKDEREEEEEKKEKTEGTPVKKSKGDRPAKTHTEIKPGQKNLKPPHTHTHTPQA